MRINWLYPEHSFDFIFPGMLWYLAVWTLMTGMFLGALAWDTGVILFRLGRWSAVQFDRAVARNRARRA